MPKLQNKPAATSAPVSGSAAELCERITDYLGNGGLFNPELMEHDKVRDLLMECRDYLHGAQPMVRMIELAWSQVRATFDGNHIHGERDSSIADWYIRVTAPDGCYAYDGWWKDSGDKSPPEVVEEAIRGACLLSNPKLNGA